MNQMQDEVAVAPVTVPLVDLEAEMQALVAQEAEGSSASNRKASGACPPGELGPDGKPCPVGEGLRGRKLKLLGSGASHAADLQQLLARTALFSGLGRKESLLLGAVMHVYEAHEGQTLITEGDLGDYMMILMRGTVDVVRRNEHNFPLRIAVANPGQTLGEMSMVDGLARFASCVAQTDCRVAVLTRAALLALLQREPVLGNKVLLKLVSLLSDRLRETSAQLVNCMAARGGSC